MVLIMTVDPGFGGQTFIPASLDKIRELKRLRTERGLSFDIEIDGGIRASNVGDAIRAGANVIVAGTAIFCWNIQENVKDFHRIFEECGKELTL